MRLKRSWSFLLATGYMVLSGKVIAFRNVFIEPLASSMKGSFEGNFREPQRTECSRMCGMPVLFPGGVLKVMEKTLLSSGRLM